MASSALPGLSLPILSIPFYYVLAVFPHGYAVSKASQGNVARHDNRNPKGSAQLEAIKKRLSPRELAAFERGESCHRNHLENMPLYIATIFAGILAEQKLGQTEAQQLGLETFVVGWNLIRIAYTANYLATETKGFWTFIRSGLYFWGNGWAFLVLYKAAVALGN